VDDILSIEHFPSFQRTVADSERRAIENCENKFTQEENCGLMAYYPACSGNSLLMFRNNLSFPSKGRESLIRVPWRRNG